MTDKWLGGIKKFGIPNLLSVFRLVLIPVFILVYLGGRKYSGPVAALVLLISGLTDMADGTIARHYHMITRLGCILDPLADKLTQAAICVSLVIRIHRPELDWILVLLILKEAVMIGAGANIIRKGRAMMPSRWFGKMATVVSYSAMMLIIGAELPPVAVNVLLWVVLGVMIFSLLMYAPFFFRIIRTPAVLEPKRFGRQNADLPSGRDAGAPGDYPEKEPARRSAAGK